MGFLSDLRYAIRQLRAAPAFALAVVLTLSVGIGANVAMFGVIDTLLFRPPAGVRNPNSLVRMQVQTIALPGEPSEISSVLSYPDYRDLKERAKGFSHVAAFAHTSVMATDDAGRSFAVPTILVTGDYFATLGVAAARGRVFSDNDDTEGGAQAVVLSHDFWQRRFAGDPAVVGRTLRLNQQAYTIVGVAPEGFTGTEPGLVGIWLPLSRAAQFGFDQGMMRSRYASWLSIVARIAPNATRAQALDAAKRAVATARVDNEPLTGGPGGPGGAPGPGFQGEVRIMIPGGPPGAGPGGGPAPAPPRPTVMLRDLAGRQQAGMPGFGARGTQFSISGWMLSVTALLLLIACANVATLLLARATKREHEISVRLSLGASPARLARQLLSESLLLAAIATAGSILLGGLALRLLPSLMPLPPMPSLSDGRLFVFACASALVAVLLFGLGPAVTASRRDLSVVLGQGARTSSGKAWGRNTLVVAQLALSLLLLVGAALFVRSLQKVTSIDTGFDLDHVMIARLDERSSRMPDAQMESFWTAARERLSAVPNVASTATSLVVPYQMNIMMPVVIPGRPTADGRPRPAGADFVGPDYFGTVGLTLLEGRGFSVDDREGSARVAVVNKLFERRYFGGQHAVGQCVTLPTPGGAGAAGSCTRIVGVVEDARYSDVTEEPMPFLYRPLAQRPRMAPGGSVLHVRSAVDAGQLTERVQRELNALQADVRVEVTPLRDFVAPQLLPWRIGTTLLAVFSALGLLLACVGLYGVVSYAVTLRTRELGVRIAVGATPGNVLAMVVRHAMRLALVGLLLGGVTSMFATRFLRSVMYGVSTSDPLSFALAAAVLLATALAAAFFPARRAARIDPVAALRFD